MRFRLWSIALLALATFVHGTGHANAFKEIEVQQRYCAGLAINVYLSDGTEVDCIKDDVAVEVDFSDHWAQAIGQSLHYASVLGTRPGIILVCNDDLRLGTCQRHLGRLIETLAYWRVGMLIWFCDSRSDANLAECRFRDLYEEGEMQ
jgi:hypothetical protein